MYTVLLAEKHIAAKRKKERKMIDSSFTRAGTRWTKREDNRLISSYSSGKTYNQIAGLKTFSGKRSLKAIRRRMERSSFGY